MLLRYVPRKARAADLQVTGAGAPASGLRPASRIAAFEVAVVRICTAAGWLGRQSCQLECLEIFGVLICSGSKRKTSRVTRRHHSPRSALTFSQATSSLCPLPEHGDARLHLSVPSGLVERARLDLTGELELDAVWISEEDGPARSEVDHWRDLNASLLQALAPRGSWPRARRRHGARGYGRPEGSARRAAMLQPSGAARESAAGPGGGADARARDDRSPRA